MYQKLLLGVAGGQNLAAIGRQLRQRQAGARLRRLFRRLRVQYRILEPVGEIAGRAAFARARRRLRLALLAALRAGDADVEVIVVTPKRPHLGEPAAIALGLAAQRLLDRRVDEDALHPRLQWRVADDGEMSRGPDMGIDIEPV